MVYKKFIKRGGKVFGPYYYESYRDENGKVRTRYVSSPSENDGKNSGSLINMPKSPTANKRLFVTVLSVALLAVLCSLIFLGVYYSSHGYSFSSKLGVTGLTVDDTANIIETSKKPASPLETNPENLQQEAAQETSDKSGYENPASSSAEITPVEQKKPAVSITAEETDTQGKAELGKEVKWTKKISVLGAEGVVKSNLTIKLPKIANNISVKKLNKQSGETTIITGYSVLNSESSNSWIQFILVLLKKIFLYPVLITGKAVSVNEAPDNIVLQITEDVDSNTDFNVEYYTPAPTSQENEIGNGKQVAIIGSDEVHYSNVLSYTDIPESAGIADKSAINVYWVEENKNIDFTAFDKDGNGIIDYIEWNTEHLSTQTFNITYNFSIYPAQNISGMKAYWVAGTFTAPPASGPNLTGEAEFSSVNYRRINKSDGLYAVTITSTNNVVRIHRFQFNITENLSTISSINFTWQGMGGGSTDARRNVSMYIWNYTASSWKYTKLSTNSTTTVNLSYFANSSLSSFIMNNNLTFILEGAGDIGNPTINLSTDYVSLLVQQTVTNNVTLNSPADNYQTNLSSGFTQINFSCNASSNVGLKNISLYITNATNSSFALNKTNTVSGITNTTSFFLNLTIGNYTWNCLAWDNKPLAEWAVSNRSLRVTPLFAGGSGNSTDPYQVSSWINLDNAKTNMTAYYVLTANLNSSSAGYSGLGNNWTPIGNSSTSFSGNFNGNNSVIFNLTINMPFGSYVGLFGASAGNISNIRLVNANVSGGGGSWYVGGLVGYQSNGVITNSSSSGSVAGGATSTGGLVGYQNIGNITNSYSSGTVTGTQYTGGLVGYDSAGVISNSYFSGSVNGSLDVGGLVGYTDGIIINCSSAGSVNGSGNYVGGLVGEQGFGSIANSYSIINGSIKGDNYVGALVGWNSFYSIENSSSIVETSARVTGTNYVGLIGSSGTIPVNCYLTIRNTTFGNITFLNWSVYGNITNATIRIGNNSAYVNGAIVLGYNYNYSANVTLIGLSTNFTNPRIFKNGFPCGSACYNFTSLNAGTVKFNVTGWSNYSIQDNFAPIMASVSLNSTNPLTNDTFQNLTCYANASDANGDILNYSGEWYRNGNIYLPNDWNTTYDGGAYDPVKDIAIDSSGNIYVTGGANNNYYTIKYNSSGSALWNATYDSGAGQDWANGIALDSSGSAYVTGYINVNNQDIYTIKYNSSGSQMWAVEAGGAYSDMGDAIAVDSSGNAYVAAQYLPVSSLVFRIIKYNSSGTNIWNSSFDYFGQPYSIAVAPSGNIYVTGPDSNSNYLTVKLNSTASVLWNATYDSGATDASFGIAIDSQENAYVTGYAGAYVNSNYYTIKYNSSGSQMWNATFDNGASEVANSISLDSYGNVYVLGYSNLTGSQKTLIVKYLSNGSQVWNFTADAALGASTALALDSSNNPYVGGAVSGNFFTTKFFNGFSNNNQAQGQQVAAGILDSKYTGILENWTCSAQAFDGTSYSSKIYSNNVTILNIAPTMGSIFLNSTNPRTNDTNQNLTCYANASDVDGSYLNYSGEWYQNGNIFIDSYWNRTFGGTTASTLEDIVLDSQNNAYVVGTISTDYLIIKYNSSGSQSWNRTFGLPGNDYAYGVDVDSQDNVYVTGFVSTNSDVLTAKYNSSGSQIWNTTWTSYAGSAEEGYALDVDNFDNVYVAGDEMGDFLLIKYNSSGSLLWNRTLNSQASLGDQAYGVVADSQGNAYLTGHTDTGCGSPCDNVWTVKYNSSGSYLWNTTFSEPGQDVGEDIALDSSNNAYVVGLTNSTVGGNTDVLLIKYDSNGNYIWNKTFQQSNYEYGMGISIDPSGNIYLAGGANFTSISWDVWVLKLNSSADLLWNKTFDGGQATDSANSIDLDSFGNPYIAGYARVGSVNNAWTIKVKEKFNLNNGISGQQAVLDSLSSSITNIGENWTCSAQAFDGMNYSSKIYSNNVTINNLPYINITSLAPANATVTANQSINFTANLSANFGLQNATLNIYNATGLYNRTTITIGGATNYLASIVVYLVEGVYTWFWEAVDMLGNYATTQVTPGNYTLTITLLPGINFTAPTPSNNANTINLSTIINVSITNASDLNQVRWNWNGTNYTCSILSYFRNINSSYSCTNYTDSSLVLAMNFDNRSELGENATRVVDLSGYSNNGTVFGGAAWNTTGKLGGVYQFDGVNDWMNISGNYSTPQRSIAFWMKSSSLGYSVYADYCNNYSYYGWLFVQGNNNQMIFKYVTFDGGLNGNNLVSKTQMINDSRWHHVLVTDNSSIMNLYFDGVLEDTEISPTPTWASNMSLVIGAYGESQVNRYFLNGSIDDLRIWNRSLSSDEAKQLYASTLNKYSSDSWNLLVNESYSEPFGSAQYNYSACAKDNSGNENCTETRALNVFGVPPALGFVAPTFPSGTITNQAIIINMSINESSLGEFKWNWNGTNYSCSILSYFLNMNSSYSCTNYSDSSLVLAMNFDNRSELGENDTKAVDLSRYGNNGTVFGSAVWNASGKYGGAYQFDGVNGYLNLTYNQQTALNSSAFTYSVWMNIRGVGPNNYASAYSGYPANWAGSINLNVVQPTGLQLQINNGTIMIYTIPASISFNQWYNFVYIVNRTTNNFSAYSNGVYLGSMSFATFNTTNLYPTIGSNQATGNSGDYFNGSIDEVRIWNRSLSASEVQQLYYSNLNKYDVDKWNFIANETNQGNGFYIYSASAKDSFGNENVSETRNLTLDTTLPNITILSPGNGTITANRSINFTANISDNLGLANATLNIYNSTGGLVNRTTIIIPGGVTNYLASIAVYLVEGIYSWFWEVFDLAGNYVNTQITEGQNRTITIASITANISVQIHTMRDAYTNNEWVNLTDPPGDSLFGTESSGGGNVGIQAWNNLTGGSHDGQDWIISSATNIAGNHTNVGRFIINTGVTATVQPYDGASYGWFEVHANQVIINGTITASGSGYGGGGGGGGGPGVTASGGTTAWGTVGALGSGSAGGSNGIAGQAYLGHGGSGGSGGGTYAGAGGLNATDGTSIDIQNGGNGGSGGYNTTGGQGDTSTDTSLRIGSGGGGGAGGNALYGPQAYCVGGAGGGAAGNPGGGFIKLYSTEKITISSTGSILAKGKSASTGNGGTGIASGYNPDWGKGCDAEGSGGAGGNAGISGSSTIGSGVYSTCYCTSSTCSPQTCSDNKGGDGGTGGAGAGGGVLLYSPVQGSIVNSGTIDARGGGDNSSIGGTVKVFYSGTYTAGSMSYGRLYGSQNVSGKTTPIENQSFVLSDKNITVYLNLSVEYYNSTTSGWDRDWAVKSGYVINLTKDTKLGLDTIWNNLSMSNGFNTNNRSRYPLGIGTYRAKVDVYNASNSLFMNSSYYNFTISANLAPVVNNVALNTTNTLRNDTNQNLTGYVSAMDYNAGDNITLAYNWYKNDVLNATTLITNGLVSYWSLNNDTKDYWGNNSGVNNGATQNNSGKVGGAYSFNGVNNFINTSYSASFNFTNTNFTFSEWINTRSSGLQDIFSQDDVSTCRIFDTLYGNAANTIQFYVFNTSGGYSYANTSSDILVNNWYHIAGVFNGTSVILYKNGNLVNAVPFRGRLAGCSRQIQIGRRGDGQFFNGSIDEVMIFNRSLNASEVKMLYEGSRLGGTVLGNNNLHGGDSWKLGVSGGDSLAWGSEASSSAVIINNINVPPRTIAVLLNSTNPLTNDTDQNLNCYANITDNESSSIYANYTWYNNSVIVSSLSGQASGVNTGVFALISTLDASYTSIGDNWTCSIQAYDGLDYENNWTNSSKIIINQLPYVNITILSPANATITANQSINFTANLSANFGLQNATLNIYNATGLYNRTTITIGGATNYLASIVVYLAEGVYTWFWEAVDMLGNYATTQVTPGNYTLTITLCPGAMNGNGSSVNPCQITNWAQLNTTRLNLAAYYILTANLSSSSAGYSGLGNNWTPIGDCGGDSCGVGAADHPFTGNFNGNNSIISDLIIIQPTTYGVGLFGSATGNISNLRLINVSINGSGDTGGLVGYLNGTISNSSSTGIVIGSADTGGLVGYLNGTISNSSSTGIVIGSADTGGLVGSQLGGVINRSYSSGNVTGYQRVGGLVGSRYGGTTLILNSYSAGSANCSADSVGGLVGYQSNGTINNSYSTASANGDSYSGGLVGRQTDGKISNCYSTGNVSLTSIPHGGLVAYVAAGTITNSYWDNQTSGQKTSDGGTGKTTAQMKSISTFSGWSINTSSIDLNNGYPYLAWQANNNSYVWLIYEPPLFAGGNGTAGNPYQIGSWTHLNNTRTNLTANYILIANLSSADSDYAGIGDNWMPIGNQTSGWQFTGNFNGNNSAISDLIINLPSRTNVGLFSYTTKNITNVGLINASITGSNFTGGLVGWQASGVISNSSSSGSVSGVKWVGGLVGYQNGGTISNSSSSGSISGSSDYVGGLAGYQNAGVIFNSYSAVNVTGYGKDVGGLVGESLAAINNSYSTGNVTGSGYNIGGLVGESWGTIFNSSSSAIVLGSSDYVGGLAGYQFVGTISDSYSTITGIVRGINYVGALIGYVSGTVQNSYSIVETSATVNGNSNVGFIGSNSGGTITNSYLTIRNITFGNITFLDWNVNGNITNTNINIGNNSAFVNSTALAGFNKSANITLIGISGYTHAVILKDGIACFAPSCNILSYTGDVIVFNVSSWSNYSIANDSTAPNIIILAPGNATITNATSINFTANISDNYGLANATLYIYNSTGGFVNQTTINLGGATNTIVGIVVYLTEGVYTWFWEVIDMLGNFVSTQITEGQNRTLTIDTTLPAINIVYPSSNNQLFNYTIGVNYTVSDNFGLDSCWWINSSGARNNLVCGQNISGITWLQGYNNVTIYVNDTAGNINSSFRNFTIDTVAPGLSIIFPANSGAYNYPNQSLLFSASDSTSGLNTCWKRLNNGNNVTISCYQNTTVNSSTEGTVEGDNTIYLWANDSAGNVNSASAYFTISTTLPVINLLAPYNGSYLNNTNVNFTFHAVSSKGIDTCELWGNWGSGWHKNLTFNNYLNDSTNSTFITIPADGNYIWNVKCNDTLNNVNWYSYNHTFIVDTSASNITILAPGNGTVTANHSINFTANISDNLGLANATLYIYNSTGGLYNQTTIIIGGATNTVVGIVVNLVEGVYTWFWQVLDLAGNLASTQTTPGNYTLTVKACPAGMEGHGISSDPCLITDCNQLQAINQNLTASYTLNNSINCSETLTWNSGAGFVPVGNEASSFNGTLNGRNKTISGLFINRSDQYVGLFGKIDTGSNLSRFGVSGNIYSNTYSPADAAGMVARNYGGIIEEVYANINVTGSYDAGSLVGSMVSGSIVRNCYADGNVMNASYAGGLIGYMLSSTVKNSYAKGIVNGSSNTGGLIGYMLNGETNNSFSASTVYGATTVGGLFGAVVGANTFSNNYWLNVTDDASKCCGSGTCNPCTTKTEASYFQGDVYPRNPPMANWTFYSIWQERIGDYPVLTWQGIGTALDTPLVNFVGLTTTNPLTNDTNQNLTINSLSTSDENNHNLTFAYNWYKNGTLNATTLITNGLIGYWPLNNDTFDYSKNHDGTNYGGAQASGKIGNGYGFNGSGSYISTYITENMGGPLTISFWMKPERNNQTVLGFSQCSPACGYYDRGFAIDQSNKVRWKVYKSGNRIAVSATSVQLNQWYHVVGVLDTINGNTIYINGVKEATNSGGTSSDGWTNNDFYFLIGHEYTYADGLDWDTMISNGYFNGTIDEVMIFNRSLSDLEIKQLYEGSRLGGNKLSSDLTEPGDIWKAGVVGYDYFGNGSETFSNNVTINQAHYINITGLMPGNGTVISNQSINFTANLSANYGLQNATLNIYNSTGGLANQTTITIGGATNYLASIVVYLAEGVYTWFWEVIDMLGNLATTQVTPGNYTLSIDTSSPSLSIVYPSNGGIYQDTNITALNYTVNDLRLRACWYSLNGGISNSTITCGQNISGLSGTDMNNTWRMWANDSAGNTASAIASFNSTYLTRCNNLTISNAYYGLHANASTSGTCFTVKAENITLDMNNFNITGDINSLDIIYGVYSQGYNNLTLKNGGIDSFGGNVFGYGIYLRNSAGHTLSNIRISNAYWGLYISSVSMSRFYNITSTLNGYGAWLDSSSNNNFYNSTINSNTHGGMNILGGSANSFYDTLFSSNTGAGLYLSGSLSNNFTRLAAQGNTLYDFGNNPLDTACNDTYFIDSSINRYKIPILSRLYFRNSSYGEIYFFNPINGTGNNLIGNGTSTIRFDNNSVHVDGSAGSGGLNKSANLTLYGLPTNFVNPQIMKDGVICGDSCYNFTSLNAGTVIFNVTSWSNYSVGSSQYCGDGTCDAGENCGNCGSDCGCGTGYTCTNNQCVSEGGGPGGCTSTGCPSASTITCGTAYTDNCGYSCGAGTQCSSGLSCVSGSCIAACTDECSFSGLKACSGDGYITCGNYDADTCLEWSSATPCGANETCSGAGNCVSACSDTCSSLGFDCGTQSICGGSVFCGNCLANYTCNSQGKCVLSSTCAPNCAGKSCGDDGCGGSCGSCGSGLQCSNGNCVEGEKPKPDEIPKDISRIGGRGCTSDYACGEYSKCEVSYSLAYLSLGSITSGEQKQLCIDNNKCLADFEKTRECSIKEEVIVENKFWCGKNYTEIREPSGKVLARIVAQTGEALDVNLNLGGSGKCSYCYDNIKDYDETGVDCGGSCGRCVEEIPKQSLFYQRSSFKFLMSTIIFVLLSISLILLVIGLKRYLDELYNLGKMTKQYRYWKTKGYDVDILGAEYDAAKRELKKK